MLTSVVKTCLIIAVMHTNKAVAKFKPEKKKIRPEWDQLINEINPTQA